ncbi:hypothetical protein OSB04_019960 [Centaurea solstitialis]|uniref:CCHC-type domain-containing protein n=1 Tax=Centaurea solstitialis TaxID=347529 RepID=A0AA38W3E7_9ASTR|nr:hypothetical protein OSB04_019960 [Centaurea solstitialis]
MGKKVKPNKARTENRCFTCNEIGHWRQNCPKRHEAEKFPLSLSILAPPTIPKPARFRLFSGYQSSARGALVRLITGGLLLKRSSLSTAQLHLTYLSPTDGSLTPHPVQHLIRRHANAGMETIVVREFDQRDLSDRDEVGTLRQSICNHPNSIVVSRRTRQLGNQIHRHVLPLPHGYLLGLELSMWSLMLNFDSQVSQTFLHVLSHVSLQPRPPIVSLQVSIHFGSTGMDRELGLVSLIQKCLPCLARYWNHSRLYRVGNSGLSATSSVDLLAP